MFLCDECQSGSGFKELFDNDSQFAFDIRSCFPSPIHNISVSVILILTDLPRIDR